MGAVLHVDWPRSNRLEPAGHEPEDLTIFKRESVLYDPDLVDYQIELIGCGSDGRRRLLGRVHARLRDIRLGFRLTIEGLVPGVGRRPVAEGERVPMRRVFFDNFGEPFANREEAGQHYHEQMQHALRWLCDQGRVTDLEQIPALR